MALNTQSPNKLQEHDLGVENDPENAYPQYGEEGRYLTRRDAAQKALKGAVAFLLNDYFAMFNDKGKASERADHRTGCSVILHAIVHELVETHGWKSREAIDALVLEAVRVGGNVEAQERRAWAEARKAETSS